MVHSTFPIPFPPILSMLKGTTHGRGLSTTWQYIYLVHHPLKRPSLARFPLSPHCMHGPWPIVPKLWWKITRRNSVQQYDYGYCNSWSQIEASLYIIPAYRGDYRKFQSRPLVGNMSLTYHPLPWNPNPNHLFSSWKSILDKPSL